MHGWMSTDSKHSIEDTVNRIRMTRRDVTRGDTRRRGGDARRREATRGDELGISGDRRSETIESATWRQGKVKTKMKMTANSMEECRRDGRIPSIAEDWCMKTNEVDCKFDGRMPRIAA